MAEAIMLKLPISTVHIPGSFPISEDLCLPELIGTSSIANTKGLLPGIEQILKEIYQTYDEVLSVRINDLKKRIRIKKRAANALLLTAHLSMHDKTLYRQQVDVINQKKIVLSAFYALEGPYSAVLGKTREQKKQLKRLLNVQGLYAARSWIPGVDDDERKALQRQIQVASDRALRASEGRDQILKKITEDLKRLNELA